MISDKGFTYQQKIPTNGYAKNSQFWKTIYTFGDQFSISPKSPKLASMFPLLRKYFSEKSALTVVVSFFCLSMTIISAVNQQLWQTIAFALAFSFSVEVICHRAKEK